VQKSTDYIAVVEANSPEEAATKALDRVEEDEGNFPVAYEDFDVIAVDLKEG